MTRTPRSFTVIGGGVVGSAIALRLQNAGLDVLLIDNGDPRRAASFGNIGHIAAEQGDPMPSSQTLLSAAGRLFAFQGPLDFRLRDAALWAPWAMQFVTASRPVHVERGSYLLSKLLHDPLGAWARMVSLAKAPSDLVRPAGHNVVWMTPERATAGVTAWDQARKVSTTTRPLEAAELEAYEAVLNRRPSGGLAFTGTGQVSEPIRVVEALRAAFTAKGGQVRTGNVSTITPHDGGVTLTLADGGFIESHAIVVAAGAWSASLMASMGVKAPVIGERGYSVQSAEHNWPADLPLTVFEDNPLVVSRFTGGLRASSHVEFGNPSAPPDPRKWKWIEDRLKGLGIQFSAQPDRWCGPRPTLPDYLPAIGQLEQAPQVYYAFGHQHLGLTLAAETAEIMEGLIVNREQPHWLSSLKIERFAKAR